MTTALIAFYFSLSFLVGSPDLAVGSSTEGQETTESNEEVKDESGGSVVITDIGGM